METLTIANFTGREHERFTINLTDGEALELELVEVNPLSDPPGKPDSLAFSLILRHQRQDAYLPQQIHRLHHPEMGILDLFMVPLGPRPDGMYYEIVFA